MLKSAPHDVHSWMMNYCVKTMEKRTVNLVSIKIYFSGFAFREMICSYYGHKWLDSPISACAMHNCSFYGKVVFRYSCLILTRFRQRHTEASFQLLQWPFSFLSSFFSDAMWFCMLQASLICAYIEIISIDLCAQLREFGRIKGEKDSLEFNKFLCMLLPYYQ